MTNEKQETTAITLTVNGETMSGVVEPRMLLSDFIRQDLQLTGTHVGCEHGVCGACTILIDGVSVRSCLTFAVQAEGCRIETVEGLLERDGKLSPLQQAFSDHHALQCGFCTPGLLMTATELLRTRPGASRDDIRDAISGNLCRCTGYQTIIDAIFDMGTRLLAEEKSA
ncbi:MAG: (2Fe-2S)-binding protein [Rhizobiaceae bacterium]|nr:(2Fe-2S)-binding protein [Rhizobiaceae bacterium]